MGQNFDDYPGFQPKTTPAQTYATQFTHGDLTQIFPTFPNPIVNLDFHMKIDIGLSWVSNNRQSSVELRTFCRICHHVVISSKWPF